MQRRAADQREAARFYARLQEEIAALPGVLSVGAANRLPLAGRWWAIGLRVEGPEPRPNEAPSGWGRAVTPGLFEALGVPLLQGRRFDASDSQAARPVVIVDELMARRLWPAGGALGRRLQIDAPEGPWAEVVGVVGNVRLSRLDETPEPFFYVPLAQATFGFYPDWGADVVVQADADPAPLVEPLRRRIQTLQADIPVFDVRTLEAHVASRLGRRLTVERLLSASALLALGLAAAGLASALAHAIRQRRREIGLRLALGAGPARVRREIVAEALRLGGTGALTGLLLAAAATPLLREMLYGVGPFDPATQLGTAAVILAVTLLASIGPARRAARTDPTRALREE